MTNLSYNAYIIDSRSDMTSCIVCSVNMYINIFMSSETNVLPHATDMVGRTINIVLLYCPQFITFICIRYVKNRSWHQDSLKCRNMKYKIYNFEENSIDGGVFFVKRTLSSCVYTPLVIKISNCISIFIKYLTIYIGLKNL